ncbi:glutathione S-transferase family protein [Pseudomonas aeruginosa]|nr:glutathione S-transferase family protein [Pseudomonas aeruginosa]
MSAKLVIGDFGKSSWSFRAWLVLVSAGIPFQTLLIPLEQPDTHQRILAHSPSGKVPALLVDNLVINDSLAICEYIAESCPQANLWPADARLRAKARAASAEMHSGFTHLRTQLSFGLNIGDQVDELQAQTREEIQRIFAIWSDLLAASGSHSFLCGGFGIVDAMFVPVVFRFRRYGIEVPDHLQPYINNVLAYPAVQKWQELAAEQL